MKDRSLTVAACAFFLIGASLIWGQVPATSPSPQATATRSTWQLADGGWTRIEQANPPRDTMTPVDPALVDIQSVMARGEYTRARKQLVDWLRANPAHLQRDLGLMLMARTLYARGERIRAFYYCDEILDTLADSPLYPQALQLQYDIADAYLRGQRDRFLGLRFVDRVDSGIEMLFRIQQRSPGSPLAEKALLRTADHYWSSGDFDLAADAYDAFGNSFPRSPLANDVQLQEARANLAQFNGPKFDATPIIDAREQLVQLATQQPAYAAQNNIEALITESDRQLARKLVISADFYRRTNKPAARRHLLERLVREFPGTPEAEKARAELGIALPPPKP